MAKVLITESILQDTADAIREKTGDSGGIKPSEFAENIGDIPAGADLSEYFESTISNGDSNIGGWVNLVKKLPDNITISGTNLNYAFYGYKGTSIPAIDTSNVTSMNSTFMFCKNLTTIPSLNTSNVTNMRDCFRETKITTIPLLDTSNVTTFERAFLGCVYLTSLPLINTQNATTIYQCFNTTALVEIPQINTSRVVNMEVAFSNNSSLTTLPLLNTSKVTNMRNIVQGTNNLTDTSLDNLLQMCINATSFTETKTFKYLVGISSSSYPASRIQALPHYQDFVDAGWTIGY